MRDAAGRVVAVVEQKDATEQQRAIGEVNAGIYAAPLEFFRRAMPGLRPKNAAGEYYLTESWPAPPALGSTSVPADFRDVSGVNDRQQLIEAEGVLRERVNARWTFQATLRDPASTVIEPDVVIGADVEMGRGVALRGRTRIGRGARIGDGVILIDTDVGNRGGGPPVHGGDRRGDWKRRSWGRFLICGQAPSWGRCPRRQFRRAEENDAG